MGYIALRPFKVQVGQGKLEWRQAGEPVPEAETWPRADSWVRRGFIAPTDQDTANRSGYNRSKLQPMIDADEAAKERSKAPVPKSKQPLPGYQGTGQSEEQQQPDVENPVQELMQLHRKDLEDLAKEHGIAGAEQMQNKAVIAEAIVAKRVQESADG